MTLTVDHSGKYLVDYQETHYGHDRDSTPDQVGDGSEIKRLRRKYSQRSDCETQPVLSECMQPVQQSEHPDGDLVDSEHSHKKSPRSVRSSSSSGPLHYLESLWELRNSEGFQNFSNRLHMHFDRKNGVLLVSEVFTDDLTCIAFYTCIVIVYCSQNEEFNSIIIIFAGRRSDVRYNATMFPEFSSVL